MSLNLNNRVVPDIIPTGSRPPAYDQHMYEYPIMYSSTFEQNKNLLLLYLASSSFSSSYLAQRTHLEERICEFCYDNQDQSTSTRSITLQSPWTSGTFLMSATLPPSWNGFKLPRNELVAEKDKFLMIILRPICWLSSSCWQDQCTYHARQLPVEGRILQLLRSRQHILPVCIL